MAVPNAPQLFFSYGKVLSQNSRKNTQQSLHLFFCVHVESNVQINNPYCQAVVNDIDSRTVCAEETDTKREGHCFQLVQCQI